MKKLSAVGILQTSEGILMLKRHPYDRTLPNFLCLPGGKLNENEDSKDGLVREFFEETNLNINESEFFVNKENERFSIDFYIVKINDINPIGISDEHESYQYIPLLELKNFESLIAPKTYEALLEYSTEFMWKEIENSDFIKPFEYNPK